MENTKGAYTKHDYEKDLIFLFDKVFNVHPSPDFKVNMGRLMQEKELCFFRIRHCKSLNDFTRICQRFFHIMGDAHTTLVTDRNLKKMYIPLTTRLIEGNVVIDRVVNYANQNNLKLNRIKSGDIILSIDNREIEAVIYDSLSQISYNNFNWGIYTVAKDIFQIDKSSGRREIPITLADHYGQVYTAQIPLFDREPVAQKRKIEKEKYRKCIEVSYFDDINCGYLKYNTCMDRSIRQGEYWNKKLTELGLALNDIPDMEEICFELFRKLNKKNYPYLILDLRDNGGGNAEVAQVMYKYLTRDKIKTYNCKVKRPADKKEKLTDLESENISAYKEYTNMVMEYPYKSRLDKDKLASLEQFSGQLYILINQGVFSAAEWLAFELFTNELGQFIGTPTGGGGAVPGDQMSFILPVTGLKLMISTKLFRPPVKLDFPGVIPHMYKEQSLIDFRKNKDTVLEYVKNIIRNNLN